jgi:hypothetical protein
VALNCSAWRPLLKYEFLGDRGETLAGFNAPQRLHFPDGDKPRKFVALFRDADDFPPRLADKTHVRFEEAFPNVIDEGRAGPWDNYHQNTDRITEPGLQVSPPSFGPGCAECVHIHWRWGKSVPDFPGKHDGTPIIPDGSNQSVELAVVAFHPGEEHPDDFHDLVGPNAEPLLDDDPLLWYSATGRQAKDTFFLHGGFFQPVPEADLALSATAPEFATPGGDLPLTFTITNQGPSFATDVALGIHRAPPIGSAFVPELSSPECAAFLAGALCRFGDMAPNTSRTAIVTFRLATRLPAGQIVTTARVAGTRRDPDGSNDGATLQTVISP